MEVLLDRVRKCEPVAQRELYTQLVNIMYNTAWRLLKNREDTEDCLQIGFSQLFRNIDQYDTKKGAFSTWSTRIFVNESLRILKKKKLRFEEINDNLNVADYSISSLEHMQANDILRFIARLPDQLQVIFNLYEIEGYSHKEIAESLDIAESSSRTYLTRAKMKLRLLIEPTMVYMKPAKITSGKFKRSEG